MRGAIAVAATLAFALSGCQGGSNSSTEASSDPLDRYVSQELDWSECGAGALCAVALVPLDWDNPGVGADVELALSKFEATGRSQGSLFVNPGGPGASGYDFVLDSVDFAVSDALRESFDVIGWDPRGVNFSSAVSCAETDEDLDHFFFGELDAEADTPEWDAELLEESIRFGQECLANTGELLEFVDTLSTVRDLDLLRALVGDDELNYLGYSYGTLIGALYIDTFPGNVGRIVLDGPVDPGASQFDLVLNQHIGFEEALVAYLEDCDLSGSCPFEGTLTERLQSVSDLYDRFEQDPIRHSDGRLVDDGMLRTAMVTTLYSQSSWPFLGRMFAELQNGVTDTAMFLVDFYYDRDNGVYQDNSMEAFIAINCLDYPVESDPSVLEAQAQQLRDAAPYTARPSGTGDLVCENWPFAPKLNKGPVRGEGANPVVILGTTGDPATPYNWSVSLNEQLENSVLLTLVGEGHLAYDERVACINDPVDTYFLTGEVPQDGLRCEA
ncbi:MAG: alpha/beta fold hydrolase [Microbacteriaceae bacterium]|nr:alpha/beta fold hydrolase [Microbacteriaceae bacterium]